jgi:DNA-binding MarR family transcriptional regulator
LVERRAAEGDRRVKLVALTKACKKLRNELARRRAEPPPELAGLPPQDLRELHRIFSAIAE